jgi:hypothetical protein
LYTFAVTPVRLIGSGPALAELVELLRVELVVVAEALWGAAALA